jgi:hypothetical protein
VIILLSDGRRTTGLTRSTPRMAADHGVFTVDSAPLRVLIGFEGWSARAPRRGNARAVADIAWGEYFTL